MKGRVETADERGEEVGWGWGSDKLQLYDNTNIPQPPPTSCSKAVVSF